MNRLFESFTLVIPGYSHLAIYNRFQFYQQSWNLIPHLFQAEVTTEYIAYIAISLYCCQFQTAFNNTDLNVITCFVAAELIQKIM